MIGSAAVIHMDQIRALEPVDRGVKWDRGEDLPETYPTGPYVMG
jgi:hypothetical protein